MLDACEERRITNGKYMIKKMDSDKFVFENMEIINKKKHKKN